MIIPSSPKRRRRMDVIIFETSKGRKFTVEVGFFDTVLEIKEKIHKYEGIPVTEQTLIFNGRVMSDDGDTEFYELLEGSHIHLSTTTEEEEEEVPPPRMIIKLPINVSLSKRRFSLECDVTDTVGRLKERIQSSEGIPSNRFVLYIGANELREMNRSLGDYGLTDHSEVNVVIRPYPYPYPYPIGGGARKKKMEVMVVVAKSGTKKIAVEVNPLDNVGELRKELAVNLNLAAEEGYFFIYKQNVMDDERTFRWHDVKHGDTIEIFNGSVTGGGS